MSAYNGFLRFTSGATHANLLAASMVVEPFLIHILAYIESVVGFESGIEHDTALQRVTNIGATD